MHFISWWLGSAEDGSDHDRSSSSIASESDCRSNTDLDAFEVRNRNASVKFVLPKFVQSFSESTDSERLPSTS